MPSLVEKTKQGWRYIGPICVKISVTCAFFQREIPINEIEIRSQIEEVAANFSKLAIQSTLIVKAAEILLTALKAGNKIIFCGNGGSAADAQHLAAELMGRFLVDRHPLPAISLTVDTSALTAIGNDYGYENVFSRQLSGIGHAGDVLVGISTSGNSRNVLLAIEVAREKGIKVVGLAGEKGGAMSDECDLCLRVPATRTDRIQEMHIAVGHMICGLVEEGYFSARS
jgi:D-sedoheptulose 7-phosphate isomerase